VERELGRGAMGVIYQAQDPVIGRTVAIKLVRADLLEGEDREEFLARFRHEAQAAGRCMHPNIVAIYDFAIHEGNPFLAMEYIEGVGLGDALKQVGRYAPAEAVSIVTQMLDALGAAHALGIVHRDIKPANVLLLPGGRVKVTDFGISRVNTSELTMDGRIVGTPAYMSPEQCRGETVDPRSDLFSCGAVLYELLTGARAFPGRNATEVTYLLLTAEPKDLVEVVPGTPLALAAALRRALAKDRAARFESAQLMADALKLALLEGAPDETMVLTRPPAVTQVPQAAAGGFDDETLDTIQRRLARHVGPIARHLVRDAAKQTSSIETLCESVARNIGPEAERARFLSDTLSGTASRTGVTAGRSTMSRTAATGSGTAGQAILSAEQIDRAERALTRAIGPIAKLLVKRALPGAASEAALWELLAGHIDRAPDRDAFLRQRPG
jgi:serine/threonine protein kinase